MTELLAALQEYSQERVIITGDLNADRDSGVVSLVMENTSLGQMASVHDLTLERYSTFKIRDKVLKRMIDFIFYQQGRFSVRESLDLLDPSILETHPDLQNGLPCRVYGSDHLHLYSVLSLL